MRAKAGLARVDGHRADLDDSCAKHNAYMSRNDVGLTHVEYPAKPGYTPEGAAAGPA
jgi:hypothetical protein